MNARQKRYDKTVQKRFVNIIIKRLEIKISDLKNKSNKTDKDESSIKHYIKKRNVFLRRLNNMTFKNIVSRHITQIKRSRGNLRHEPIGIWSDSNMSDSNGLNDSNDLTNAIGLIGMNDLSFIKYEDELTDTDSS